MTTKNKPIACCWTSRAREKLLVLMSDGDVVAFWGAFAFDVRTAAMLDGVRDDGILPDWARIDMHE